MSFIDLFKFEPDHRVQYTLEEVEKIYREKTSSADEHVYFLKVRFSYSNEGSKDLFSTAINIQFAPQLHIGGVYKNNKIKVPEGWNEYSLSEKLFNSKVRAVQDKDYLSAGHLFSIPKENKKLSKRVCIYEFEQPFFLKGKAIHFISFPSFEIARYFLFDAQKYNHKLLESEFSADSENNLIFNPNSTYKLKHSKKCVYLRSEIEDISAKKAGDLAFKKSFRKQVKKLISTLNEYAGNRNIRTFYNMELPIKNFSQFDVLGYVGSNNLDKEGLIVQHILKVEGYNEEFLFARDNDGRSVENKPKNLNKSFQGFKTVAQSSGASKEVEQKSTEIANPYIESFELELENEFSRDERINTVKKIEKTEQDSENDGSSSPQETDPNASAGISNEGQSTSKNQPTDISNKDLDKKRSELEKTFWKEFPNIFKEIISKGLVDKVEYVSTNQNQVLFSERRLCEQTSIRKGSDTIFVKYYFLQVISRGKYVYILEYDQKKFENSTIIIKAKKFTGPIHRNNLLDIHGRIRGAKGSTKYVNSKAYEKIKVKHSYKKRKGQKGEEYFTPEEVVKKHRDKIVKHILNLTR